MKIQALKQKRKKSRKLSIRKKIFGTSDRLRLSIYKSTDHIYAQLINDVLGRTIISASSVDKEAKSIIKSDMTKTQIGTVVGKIIAQRAGKSNISKVVFDRNGNVYRGRVKALAEAAREAGLDF